MVEGYEDFLRRKIEIARILKRAGYGRSNDEVEAEFVARRDDAVTSHR